MEKEELRKLISKESESHSSEDFRSFLQKIAYLSAASLTASLVGQSPKTSVVVGRDESASSAKNLDKTGQWKILSR